MALALCGLIACIRTSAEPLPRTPVQELAEEQNAVPFAQAQALDASDQDLLALNGLDACLQLRTLNLASNLLTDLTPIAALPELQQLSLADNPYLESMEGLAGSPVVTLDLSDNPQLSTLAHLADLPALAELDLRGIGEQAPRLLATLPALPHLRTLVFDKAYLTDLDWIARCPRLEDLRIIGDGWPDSFGPPLGLTPLAGLTSLQILELSGIRADSLAPLEGLTELRELTVEFSQDSTDTSLEPLAGLGQLQRLSLGIIGDDLLTLQKLDQLRSLRVGVVGTVDLGLLPEFAPLREFDLTLYAESMDVWPEGYVIPPLTVDLSPLQRYPELETLRLKNVAVDPSIYAQFTTLKSLSVGGYKVELSPLALPPTLESLELRSPDQTVVDSLRDAKHLRALKLVDASAFNWEPLSGLTELEDLEITILTTSITGGGNWPPDLSGGDEAVIQRILDRSFVSLEWASDLTQLQRLLIAADGLVIPPPVSLRPLEGMTALEELDLDAFHKGADFEALSSCGALRVLRLGEAAVPSLEFLQHLPHLEELDITVAAPDTALEPLRSATALRDLRLQVPLPEPYDMEWAVDIAPLASLRRLEHLEIGGAIADVGPLQFLPRLRSLALWLRRDLEDLAPLVANPGINRGDYLRLPSYHPADGSQLAALEERGVEIARHRGH